MYTLNQIIVLPQTHKSPEKQKKIKVKSQEIGVFVKIPETLY